MKPCPSVTDTSAASSREEGAGGRRDLEGAVGREALLELGRRRIGDAERDGASTPLARGVDYRGCEGEDLHLTFPVGEGLIDEELGALGGAIESSLGVALHEAVERLVGAPRQDQDESRSTEAGAQKEATLQRGGGADDRFVRVGERRHEMSRAEGASRVIEAGARV